MKITVSQAITNGYFKNKQWFSEFDYLFFQHNLNISQFLNCCSWYAQNAMPICYERKIKAHFSYYWSVVNE